MLTVWSYLQTRMAGDEGASLVEYALLLVLIAVAAIVGMGALGDNTQAQFADVAATIAP
ncbi:MAG: Flp family type IVb pilin [Acidimicrobiia bacterium]|nr:Flp family type IVb pilin [Acidimicrobiia bacterium]MDH3470952.1 Flp family type IVb pilin [Acidimicrobiia bacterium]